MKEARERETRNRGATQGARSRGGCNGRRWSKVAGGCDCSGCSRERARARERESERKRETRNEGVVQGARSCGGCNGHRWSKVAGGCGGSGCSGERERGKELQRRKCGEEEGFAKFEP